MQSFLLIVFALLFSNASAAATGGSSLARSLVLRQSPSIPNASGCASQCTPLSSVSNCVEQNSSNPTACTCSSSFASTLSSCYQCAVAAGALTQSDAQTILQEVSTACSDAGTPFSSAPSLSGSGSGSKKSGAVMVGASYPTGAALMVAISIILYS